MTGSGVTEPLGSLLANVRYEVPRRRPALVEARRGAWKEQPVQLRLGIDVACRAAHQASLADETGQFVWTGHAFRTRAEDLERLWAMLPEETKPADVLVIMEPTRNAWVPLAAWFSPPRRARRAGAAGTVGGPACLLPQAHQERPHRLAPARETAAVAPGGAARRARPRAGAAPASRDPAAPDARQAAHDVAGPARRAA